MCLKICVLKLHIFRAFELAINWPSKAFLFKDKCSVYSHSRYCSVVFEQMPNGWSTYSNKAFSSKMILVGAVRSHGKEWYSSSGLEPWGPAWGGFWEAVWFLGGGGEGGIWQLQAQWVLCPLAVSLGSAACSAPCRLRPSPHSTKWNTKCTFKDRRVLEVSENEDGEWAVYVLEAHCLWVSANAQKIPAEDGLAFVTSR